MLREDLFGGLPYNYEATTADVANISGQNRVRGIHRKEPADIQNPLVLFWIRKQTLT